MNLLLWVKTMPYELIGGPLDGQVLMLSRKVEYHYIPTMRGPILDMTIYELIYRARGDRLVFQGYRKV